MCILITLSISLARIRRTAAPEPFCQEQAGPAGLAGPTGLLSGPSDSAGPAGLAGMLGHQALWRVDSVPNMNIYRKKGFYKLIVL